MNIKPIHDFLYENGLKYPNLEVLQSTDALYTALLVQPEARIQVRNELIRNADRASAHAMFDVITREAYAQSVDLLVTPEYSFLVMNLLILLRIFFALCKRGVAVARMPLLKVVERMVRHHLAHDTWRRESMYQMATS